MQNKFNKLIIKHETCLKKNERLFSIVGYIKLLLVLVLGVAIYFTLSKKIERNFGVTSIISLGLFILLWFYHNSLGEKIHYSKGIISINKKHLDRIAGKWISFSDMGEEFISCEHAYACDLDIVGKKSLFQFLNATNTWHGRQLFANDLLYTMYTADEIQGRQEAILELSKDLEFSSHISYHISKIEADYSIEKLVNELKDKKIFVKSKIMRGFLIYLPLVNLIFIASTIVFKLENLYFIGAIVTLLQGIIWVSGMLKTQKYLGSVIHLSYKLSAYSTVIKILKDRQFTCEKLKQIQAQLGTSSLSAEQAIKDLSEISNRASIKSNPIANFILNLFYLWDCKNAFLLESWKNKYAHLVEKWFLTLGEFESLMSFSHLGNLCTDLSLPTIIKKSGLVEAKEMGHPLLTNGIRVRNDVVLDHDIFIISGSNMSGKTTFLRTVGINLVLAQCGCFVCAKEMTFSPMKIITSMRIADDLSEGVSTFYAELKRIKDIIELAKKESNMIFLIDEIFRGTNSVDRLNGAEAILVTLNKLGVMGIITTHDLELCTLANQYFKIKNYSFSEYYKDNKICFDYRIKVGKSTTTNGKYLMEMVGIF